jgi:hypothetical protein
MAGMQVPLEMLMRFTSFLGTQVFWTQPIAVSPFSAVTMNLWTGQFIGTGVPSATFTLEESNDAEQFSPCGGAFPSIVLATSTQFQLQATISRAWLRMSVGLAGVRCVQGARGRCRERRERIAEIVDSRHEHPKGRPGRHGQARRPNCIFRRAADAAWNGSGSHNRRHESDEGPETLVAVRNHSNRAWASDTEFEDPGASCTVCGPRGRTSVQTWNTNKDRGYAAE